MPLLVGVTAVVLQLAVMELRSGAKGEEEAVAVIFSRICLHFC